MITQGTRQQTTKPILGTPILGMPILGTAVPWCARLSSNIPGFVSVDLIGKNNQVILEFEVKASARMPCTRVPQLNVYVALQQRRNRINKDYSHMYSQDYYLHSHMPLKLLLFFTSIDVVWQVYFKSSQTSWTLVWISSPIPLYLISLWHEYGLFSCRSSFQIQSHRYNKYIKMLIISKTLFSWGHQPEYYL